MSQIEAIPVKELVRRADYQQRGVRFETFVIPAYQRGYRWTEIHVKALLKDIHDFMHKSASKHDKYCLQPIVVSKSPANPAMWELIDGQQRLTTLFILLHVLQKPCFDLVFESRKESTDFVKNLVANGFEQHDDPDFHFMSEARNEIVNWFEQYTEVDIEYMSTFATILMNQVDVIWYAIESVSRDKNIDIFNRLNDGKIPLTDAELVKALLLSKIKGLYTDHELTLRQAEISNTWHAMETQLRRPDKWGFLTNRETAAYKSHIELIFDLIANIQEKDNYSTFLWFEKQIVEPAADLQTEGQRAVSLWKNICEAYALVNSWFCENTPDAAPTLYHYIGYLLADKRSITDLFNKARTSSNKQEFLHWLHSEILKTIEQTDPENISYNQDNQKIHRYLLLFNVLSCEKIAHGHINRFPFDRFNAEHPWSLEHILAQHSQDPMKDQKAIREWIRETLHSLSNLDSFQIQGAEGTITICLTEQKRRLAEMADTPEINIDEFHSIREILNKHFGETAVIHNLGNMALLSQKDNAALNNSIFPVKRDKIIAMEKSGRFIPPCTRNVFLKYYSEADTQPYFWSIKDQQAYMETIIKTINEFKTGMR